MFIKLITCSRYQSIVINLVILSRPPAVLAKRGVRSVPVLVSVERGQLVTFTCAANVQGRFIPPIFVLPKNSRYVGTTSAPIGSLFFKTSKEWSTTDAFCRWLKHFRTQAAENCRTPILLILDNHSSHISYLAVKYCMENNIELLTLPPHTTHKLQPLDVSFFSPLKTKKPDRFAFDESEFYPELEDRTIAQEDPNIQKNDDPDNNGVGVGETTNQKNSDNDDSQFGQIGQEFNRDESGNTPD
ncbi:unnamed protein product [Allacma fusca]|uniref:DDE-1 domain-containing protein n=1 Tax=Allacma fusca TaxID=39272 RepID=A0A8J2K844_9HEXA|nr:unnamed protein product [Allacma fusca]